MKTISIKLHGRALTIKAMKAEAERFYGLLSDLNKAGNRFKELYGVKPENETPEEFAALLQNAPVVQSIFGDAPAPQAVKDWFLALPEVITTKEIPDLRLAGKKLLAENTGIKDSRRTQAEQNEIRELNLKHKADQEAEKNLFLDTWCKSREQVETPVGQMAVYLEITFDDSDGRSDYFHPHSQLGVDMLLGFVPKGAHAEKTAREVLSRYPDLAAREWSWHTENYSMGHGNYLMSKPFDTWKHKAYDGRENVAVSYEIRFGSGKLHVYKNYTEKAVSAQVLTPASGEVEMRLNSELNGVELIFASKPSPEVIAQVKAIGFRWSPKNSLWYAKQTPEKIEFAKSLANKI